ncbi:MAG: hypothetical protein FWE41_04930 [Coriobacteriia bacterium]|nr:hypothetical protein [Coriobacteriia bacterium]MCL2750655.1 hypothetical protein [Coriobacteriia bacterium]
MSQQTLVVTVNMTAGMNEKLPHPAGKVIIDTSAAVAAGAADAAGTAGAPGGIGSGIAEVLDAAFRELTENEVVGDDLDKIFWSSVNADAKCYSGDSLDNTFYGSIIEGDTWTPKQLDLTSPAPPSGQPVSIEIPSNLSREAIIDQVAEFAVREVDRLIHQSQAAPDDEGDYLLFTDGENGIYVGRPQQYGVLYDNPKDHMKDLLNNFYRGNKQELEQVAYQIIDNALKGTPIDVRKWLNR